MANNNMNKRSIVVIVDFLIIMGIKYSLISEILSFSLGGIFFCESSFEKIDEILSLLVSVLTVMLLKEKFLKNEIADNAIPPINMKILFKIVSPVQ